jgi:hypothetical protein
MKARDELKNSCGLQVKAKNAAILFTRIGENKKEVVG